MLCKIMTGTYGIGHILHWNDRNLSEFPEDLKRHRDRVHQLYIKNNYIEILPKWINSLSKLSHIYIGNNKLSSIPDELTQLKSLEVLCAPCNFITDIPPALSALNRLTQLDLSRNLLKKVPREILNMRSLWLLDLSNNKIETLPEIDPDGLYFGEIILNSNKLLCVPDNLARLKNIEYLSLTNNRLLYVPAVQIFRSDARIKVDDNAFLNYVPIGTSAQLCGTQRFPEANALPNSILKCAGRDLILSPKIKQVFSVLGNTGHCPSLKEFTLRFLHVWRTPFAKDHLPKHLYGQLLSGPAATCMQCHRPLFTYSYMCLFQQEAVVHIEAQYFCSKSCYSAFQQIYKCQLRVYSKELDFEIKPYGFLPSLL